MEVTGKIIQVFEPQSGVSRTGNNWKKREYLLEVPGQYPRKIFFSFFGDRADQFILTGGQDYKISFDIESREYNGRYFTEIRAWKAEAPDGQPIAGGSQAPSYNSASSSNSTFQSQQPAFNDPFGASPGASQDIPSSPADDLPF